MSVAVIGAGLTGHLVWAGLKRKPIVFEKSRARGGRFATRWWEEGQKFDHGIQYSKAALHDLFSGVDPDLFCHRPDFGHFILGGMNQLFKKLNAPVQFEKKLKGVTVSKPGELGRYLLNFEDETSIPAHHVVFTQPWAQLVGCELPEGPMALIEARAMEVQYSPRLVILLESQSELKELSTDDFQIWSQFKKRLTTQPHRYAVVVSGELSQSWYELTDEQVLDRFEHLLRSSQSASQAELRILRSDVKRWRYAFCNRGLAAPYLKLGDGLFYVSDACGFSSGAIDDVSRVKHCVREFLAKESGELSL